MFEKSLYSHILKFHVRSTLGVSICVLAALFTFIPFNRAEAQDLNLEETLQQLSEIAAKSYARPVTDAIGINLNGGWFHRAPEAKLFGLSLEFGIVAMGTFLDDADKTFSASAPWRFSAEQAADLAADINPLVRDLVVDEILSNDFNVTIAGPTAIGSDQNNVSVVFSGDEVLGETIGGQTFELEGITGLAADLDILPLATPQLTIGTVFGSMVTLRWLPDIEIDEDIGTISYFGFGIQHNFQSWIRTPLPVEVSLGYFTQTLDIGDIIKASTNSYGVTLSKQIGGRFLNLTSYAGYMFESSEMDFNYSFEIDTPGGGTDTQNIAFTLDGINENRTIIGLSLRFAILNINADYNFGKKNSATAGLMFAF
jgi:hypothetical protein